MSKAPTIEELTRKRDDEAWNGHGLACAIIDYLEAMEKGEPQKDGAWLRERSAFVDAIAYACDTLRSVVPPDERDASLRDLAFMAAKSIRELTRERDEARAKLAEQAKAADDWRQRCEVVACKERGYSVQSPGRTHFWGTDWVRNAGSISAVGFWGSLDEARTALATAPPPPDWSEPSTPVSSGYAQVLHPEDQYKPVAVAKPDAGDEWEQAAHDWACKEGESGSEHYSIAYNAFRAGHARGSK